MEWYCLVTLIDLQTRRAGLSAPSAELLVATTTIFNVAIHKQEAQLMLTTCATRLAWYHFGSIATFH